MKIKIFSGHIIIWLVVNYLLLSNFSDFNANSNSAEQLSTHIDNSSNLPYGIVLLSLSYLVVGFVFINWYLKKK